MALTPNLQKIVASASGLYFIERTSQATTVVAELDGYRLLIGQSKKGITNKIVTVNTYNEFVSLFTSL